MTSQRPVPAAAMAIRADCTRCRVEGADQLAWESPPDLVRGGITHAKQSNRS